ncbi:hypothetical protein [Anaeromyxobacter sp. PSR-1]|uniref:hypothetical protein n=1 Tax=unclassified Anaeromyxobacter TaxID=2620896 RepID=UPI0005DF0292|nr:hypothetical protein [Anaeromyxobacter sp. PSR-1]GAO01565.1 hypothetical protein PSR1_00421 [Anaeromyxobacter sp. PSR-1]
MSRIKILLLCVPVALAGLGVALHATWRMAALERALQAADAEARDAGRAFVQTLQGEHAERQRIALDRRRTLALDMAAARRDRLLGLLATGAAGLLGAALSVMARISAEVEEDRRHVRAAAGDHGPDRS